MADDPHPEFRCRCVYRGRTRHTAADEGWPDDYYDRCPLPATQEDGLCDHCRQTVCSDEHPTFPWPCCVHGEYRRLSAQDEPCLDHSVASAPF